MKITDPETKDRMDGLIDNRALAAARAALSSIRIDLESEGFDTDDIIEYVMEEIVEPEFYD